MTKNLNKIAYLNKKKMTKNTVKYVGVTIDKHLKWKPHIDELTSILYYLQKYLSTANLKLVYHALVKSKLHYGILLWGNAYKTTLTNLNKIHNRALRYITKLPYRTNIDKLFANANLLKINKLFKFTASKYMFKLLYNNGPKNDMQLLSEIHTHNTRQSKNKNVFVSNLLSSNLSCYYKLL